MIRKRIIGAITVRQGIAVQSFGYRRYLPLGKPEVVAANFDRWGADEIVVTSIDRSATGAGPDMTLLKRMADKGLATPLVYGGGIRNVDDACAVIGAGADRLLCDALLHDDPAMIEQIGGAVGIQAVIGCLPLSIERGVLTWYDYRQRISKPLSADLRALIEAGALSELLITDWRHEGEAGGFDPMLLAVGRLGVPLITFGGISEPVVAKSLLAKREVAAVAIGNFLGYREHAIQRMREAIGDGDLRKPCYSREDD
ncbi:MAG: HisA/HisF-related TIM barrel protein [Pseudomonadota bacterium]